ncbi:MAG: hypothetical protein ACLU9S_02815 [Oscillospiraceae bacterium]
MVQLLVPCPPPEHGHRQNEQVQGEFLTVSLLEQKGYDPHGATACSACQSHYRRNLVFSWENLDNAKPAYDKLMARIARPEARATARWTRRPFEQLQGAISARRVGQRPQHLSGHHRPVRCAEGQDATTPPSWRPLADFDRVLSLDLLAHGEKQRQADREAQAQEERDPEIDALVQQRTEAKKAKNWAEADRIRDELKARGITITDTPQGTKWSRQ